jgi:cytochrome c2
MKSNCKTEQSPFATIRGFRKFGCCRRRQTPLSSSIGMLGIILCGMPLLLFGTLDGNAAEKKARVPTDGPANPGMPVREQLGNASAGKAVFRFETFGNEGFWTDALKLPAGMMASKTTPLRLLQLGVGVDIDALDPETLKTLTEQLRTDPTGQTSAMLNDPEMTIKLVNANAVIGMVPKRSTGAGPMDITKGDKVGATCALCHTTTDGSALNLANGGSIGHRQDGRTPHFLDVGTLVSLAANSRAFFPLLQLSLEANHGKTLGRAPQGLTGKSTEAEVKAYLTNKDYYPVGMFDDAPDGNGAPMHIQPLFRQDLAFPYGSEGALSKEDNFANLVYTGLLDPTNLTSPGGRAFLHKLGGKAGDEIADTYVAVLAATGVTGYPYVVAAPPSDPKAAGTEEYMLGVRVDNTKLLDMNAYVFRPQAPPGVTKDAAAVARGRKSFQTTGCTGCHNVDQSKSVPSFIVSMKKIVPGDNPEVLARREPPLNPVEHTPESTFDAKMAVVNASVRGLQRGIALPLLLDLARKPVFLHDNSVASLNDLLNPRRGDKVPHPFYMRTEAARADMIEFLDSLGTN